MNSIFKRSNIFSVILSLCISLIIITLIVKIALNTKAIYYYDVVNLDLAKSSKLTINEIKSNYDYVIKYVQSPKYDFNLPTLPYSKEGKVHFEEVRDIFSFFNKLQSLLLLTTLLIFILNFKYHNYNFLKLSSVFLIIIPLTLFIPFLINFDKSFTAFHKLFFKNDYWLLDTTRDPIINIMPQEYFFHCAMFIILLLIIASLLLYAIYRIIINNNKKSDRFIRDN